MQRLTVEPHAPVASLEELSALAARIEADAAAAYGALAARMRRAQRSDLAGLFETLAEEARRRSAATGRAARPAAAQAAGLMLLFDDEGLAGTAPERASAYGAFAMAVRNARRAFAFWTYVAAHSPTQEVRQAAEELARESLARMAALRRERRRAYHRERGAADAWTPEALERRLAALLADAGHEALAGQALARAEALGRAPLGQPKPFRHIRPQSVDHPRPAAELLLDGYLDLAERLPTEEARGRAQLYAAQLLDCLSAAAAANGTREP